MYVPLVRKAYDLWHELEQLSGKQLLLKTGGIILGNEEASVIKGARLSAKMHNVPYEYLNSKEIAERFPALKPEKDTFAVVEEDAGILFPEECIKTNLEQAAANGAALFYNEVVIRINIKNNTVEIITNKSSYETKKLIVTAGAWLKDLLPELHLPLKVKRQVLFWFKNIDEPLQKFIEPDKLPVYIWEYKQGRIFYGFPDLGKGLKMAPHHEGQAIHPDLLSKEVSEEETSQMKNIADKYFNLKTVFGYSDVCMYTNTPDEHFIIDYYPGTSNIVIASPCSGHGFKFSSAIGEILCNMTTGKTLDFELTPFSLKRFSA